MSVGSSGLALRGDGAVEGGDLILAQELAFEFAEGDMGDVVGSLV